MRFLWFQTSSRRKACDVLSQRGTFTVPCVYISRGYRVDEEAVPFLPGLESRSESTGMDDDNIQAALPVNQEGGSHRTHF